ncbi:MAG TPA: InlB B-repeat-containing protein, partial [Spirochaetota bacterium]|nr:InlB B-repeat-containing protein [Spirochaetota bacterium]
TIGLSGALTGAWDVVVTNLDGQSATLSGGFTVTWPQFRVIFNANGGTGSMADQFITRDSSANLTLNVFTRSGYTFANWNTLANGSGTTYTDTALFPMGSADVTLYAQWTADSYTITYMLNGGTNDSGNPASYTVETPTITLQPATRAGYEFGGWYSDAGFTVQVTQIPVGSTGDRTLYAQWVTGYLDTSFDPGTGANGTVRSVAVLPSGKIAIGGDFTTFDGVTRNSVARIVP